MDEMGKGLVGLAEARFGKTKLNAAEKKFFKGVGDGEVVDLRKGDEEFDKPDNAENWKGRRIRSDRVAWLCSDGDALGMVTHKGISVFGARFDEELDLSYAQMPFRLVFRECAFAEKVNLRMVSAREIIFNGSHTKVINGNSLSVEGWLHFAEGFRAEEQVCLQDAKAGGLYCSKGVFVNPKGTALNCGGIEVKGDVFLSDDFSSEGEVSFWGAAIGGILSCTNGKFSNTKREKPEGVKKTDERRALHCDGIKVKGGVFLDNGFSSEGVVRFPSATIGGVLSCTNGKFSNPEGTALFCDGIEVKSSVFLSDGFSAEGGVRFLGATLGRNLNCTNGKFSNAKREEPDERKALSCDRIEVKGAVFLRNGFSSEGEVRFFGATIGGSFDCEDSTFSNTKQRALNCEGMAVKGNILFRKSAKTKGAVVLADVTVGSNVGFVDCTLSGQEGLSVLNAKRMCVEGDLVFERVEFVGDVELGGCRVKGELKWKGITEKKPGKLDLRYGEVGTLNDEKGSWPEKILLNGFVCKDAYSDAPVSSEKCIERLDLQPRYYSEPYEQAAKVFRECGHEDAAKDVLIAMNEKRGKRVRWHNSTWCWYKVLGPMIGYGYRPYWALFRGPFRKYKGKCWLDSFFVRSIGSIFSWIFLGSVLFGMGYYCDSEVMRPVRARSFAEYVVEGEKKDSKAEAKKAGEMTIFDKDAEKRNCDVCKEYPAFQFLAYSVDMFVPVVDLQQGKYWLPSANRGAELVKIGCLRITTGGVLLCYLWVHIAAGWVLSTLLVLGFTGVVRK